jgi:di/tripeptidase
MSEQNKEVYDLVFQAGVEVAGLRSLLKYLQPHFKEESEAGRMIAGALSEGFGAAIAQEFERTQMQNKILANFADQVAATIGEGDDNGEGVGALVREAKAALGVRPDA